MIDINLLNGVVRVHGGGIQLYIYNEIVPDFVWFLVNEFAEDEEYNRIPFDSEIDWEELGWECMLELDEGNISDFMRTIDEMFPVYLNGQEIGYAYGKEHQSLYQGMLGAFEQSEKFKDLYNVVLEKIQKHK